MMWPDSLCREIAEKRCILHVGTGLSCQSLCSSGKKPPSWPELLNMLKSKLAIASHRQLVDDLLLKDKFLDAAEVIRTNISAAEYSAVIKEQFVTAGYAPSVSHEHVIRTSPKIFVTTNYDTIMESTLTKVAGIDSFTQFEHATNGLNDSIRSPDTILVKMHGCAKHPGDTILSRSDYFRLRSAHECFFNTMQSLYSVNTVLFIGCGFEDPDISLILENIRISNPDVSHPSYALLGNMSYGARMQTLLKSQYNIEAIVYPQKSVDDHSGFEPALEELKDSVELTRTKFGVP